MDTPKKNNNSRPILKEVQSPTFQNEALSFKGPRFEVRTILVPGRTIKTTKRDVVVTPGAVVILPFLDQQNIVMIKNERFAVGKELWELPAGTLEPSESPIDTAKRELIEETGYQAEDLMPLMSFYTTPGICNETMHAFVAKELKFVGQALEDSEKITVEIISQKNAFEMIRNGTIIDGKTVATLLFYGTFISEMSQ